MMKIITTVGASLFSNLDQKFDACIKAILSSLKEEPASKWELYGGNDSEASDSDIPALRAFCRRGNFQSHFTDSECSAETATLEKILDETGVKHDYEVYLLCTDTILSRLASELLATYSPLLQGKTKVINDAGKPENVAQGVVVYALSVDDAKGLKTSGLANFVKEIQKVWRSQYDGTSTHSVVLNASGGYKGIIPFLTLIAQLFGFPIYYKYQDEGEKTRRHLISIDALPFGYNWELIYELSPYLTSKWIKEAKDPRKKDILEILEKEKLVDRGDLTDVGAMLRAFYDGVSLAEIKEVDRLTPDGKERSSCSSLLAEFKFYEWRSHITYKYNGKPYPIVSRSSGKGQLELKKHNIMFSEQIDVVMENDEGSGFVVGEVKYAFWLAPELARAHKALETPRAVIDKVNQEAQGAVKIASQIERRLKECGTNLPDEFHVYAYSVLPLSEKDFASLVEYIKKLDGKIRENYAEGPLLKAFYGAFGAKPRSIANMPAKDFDNAMSLIYSSESHS